MKKYRLQIKPALEPAERHKVGGCLRKLGYHVSGGGTHADMSKCSISFEKPENDKV